MRLPMSPARLVSTVLMATPLSVILVVAAAATLVAAVAVVADAATARLASAVAVGFADVGAGVCVGGAAVPVPRPLPRVDAMSITPKSAGSSVIELAPFRGCRIH